MYVVSSNYINISLWSCLLDALSPLRYFFNPLALKII